MSPISEFKIRFSESAKSGGVSAGWCYNPSGTQLNGWWICGPAWTNLACGPKSKWRNERYGLDWFGFFPSGCVSLKQAARWPLPAERRSAGLPWHCRATFGRLRYCRRWQMSACCSIHWSKLMNFQCIRKSRTTTETIWCLLFSCKPISIQK